MRKLLLVFLLLQIGLFAQLSNTNIWMMRGDTKTLSFNYNGNILNDSLIFVVKSSKEITAVRLISKTTYDNQINILFGVSSFVYVRLDAGDTDDLTLAKYYYDITRIHNGDSTTIFIGELNLQPDIGTPFDGTDVVGRVTTVSLNNGTIEHELVWWNDSLNYWAPSGVTFSSGGSVGDADSLGGIPASEYLVKSDSTDQRTFSDLKYPNKYLSDLGTTSINANLLPVTTNTLSLGSTSKYWFRIYANYLNMSNSGYTISLRAGTLTQPRIVNFPNVDGTIPVGTGTANQLSYWSGTNTLGSLALDPATLEINGSNQLTVIGGTGSSGWFGLDGNGDLMPSLTATSDDYYELDGNGDIMPQL